MMMLYPIAVISSHTMCYVVYSDPGASCSHTAHLLTHPLKGSHLKLVASELHPNVLTTRSWPTVVQHTAAHARYVTHALRPKGAREPKLFSVGTGGRGLLGQRLGTLAQQGHETLRGGARMTWLFRVRPGNVKP
jgi:hypothetical protein